MLSSQVQGMINKQLIENGISPLRMTHLNSSQGQTEPHPHSLWLSTGRVQSAHQSPVVKHIRVLLLQFHHKASEWHSPLRFSSSEIENSSQSNNSHAVLYSGQSLNDLSSLMWNIHTSTWFLPISSFKTCSGSSYYYRKLKPENQLTNWFITIECST